MVDKVEEGIFDLTDEELQLAVAPVATDKLIQVLEHLYSVAVRVKDSMDPIAGKPIDKDELVDMDKGVSDSISVVTRGESEPFIAVESYRGKQEKNRLLNEFGNRIGFIMGRLEKLIKARQKPNEGAGDE